MAISCKLPWQPGFARIWRCLRFTYSGNLSRELPECAITDCARICGDLSERQLEIVMSEFFAYLFFNFPDFSRLHFIIIIIIIYYTLQ